MAMDGTTQTQEPTNPPAVPGTMEAGTGSESATPGSGAKLIRRIKQATRRKISVEDKVRIILEGFRKEIPVSDLCRRERVSTAIYYSWSKDFMEAGKAQLRGDTLRGATQDEVLRLKQENSQLKELLGEQALELSLFKKSLL
jgi:transposase-like protein